MRRRLARAKLLIAALLAAIVALDLCAMLFARYVVGWVAIPLQVAGAVMEIVQLAFGLHAILVSLNALTVISYQGR